MARVFISYKRVDKAKVFKLKDKIEAAIGEECWIDLDGIKSDAIFKSVIIRAINESEIFLFMYSKAHSTIEDFEHDWTVRELSFAELKKKRIVFINIDGSTLSDLFLFDYANKQQVDATSPQALDRLCTDLQKWLGCSTQSTTKQNKKAKTSTNRSVTVSNKDLRYQRDPQFTSDMVKLGNDYYYGINGKQKDYTKAVEWYKKAAMLEYSSAQRLLGRCYANGEGVAKSYESAVMWYQKSARQGNKEAQFDLGVCYRNGQGVTKNYAQAAKWFRNAAEQGHIYAQFNLGLCYANGNGVEKDYEQAMKWYRKAAEQGLVDAQYNLGICFYNGYGIKKNPKEAAEWFLKAAQQGHVHAKLLLNYISDHKQSISDHKQSIIERLKNLF